MSRASLPKYVQTKQKLVRMIRSGRWPVGSPFPSESQLLDQFDVSRPTLVRSLQDLVREGYLHRRQGQGTFVADYPRHGLNGGRLPILFSCESWEKTGDDRHVLDGVMAGIRLATADRQVEPFVLPVLNGKLDGEVRAELDRLPPGGAVVYLPDVCPEVCDYLRTRGCRIWGMGQPADAVDCVYVDEEHAAWLATRYLLDHGRRRIALLNGPLDAYWGFSARLRGYQRALTEAGIAVDPALTREDHHVLDSESGRSMMRQIIDARVPFDGVFGVTDRKAMGAMAALLECGHQVPGTIGMVSLDDTLAHRSVPPLSAVRYPLAEMARVAVDRLFQAPDRDLHVASRTTIRLEATLTDRGSG